MACIGVLEGGPPRGDRHCLREGCQTREGREGHSLREHCQTPSALADCARARRLHEYCRGRAGGLREDGQAARGRANCAGARGRTRPGGQSLPAVRLREGWHTAGVWRAGGRAHCVRGRTAGGRGTPSSCRPESEPDNTPAHSHRASSPRPHSLSDLSREPETRSGCPPSCQPGPTVRCV